MKTLWMAALVSGVLALSASAFAEEPVAPAADAAAEASAPAEAPAAAPAAVQLSASGDHVVQVNTGNQTVDAVANLAAKCAERSAAYRGCESLGGFKAMACRKAADFRYKGVECPL